MAWKVVVDIAPKTIEGTNGCHKYVFRHCRTKKEADMTARELNALKHQFSGTATVERCDTSCSIVTE